MTAVWTDPGAKDWESGQIVIESEMDTYVSQNPLYLYELLTGAQPGVNVALAANLTVRTTGLVVNATGVGVGIAPASAFDVNAAARFRSTVQLDGAVTASSTIAVSGDVTVRTDKLVVTATGVGVGMTPALAFDVTGASRFHSAVQFDAAVTVVAGGAAITGTTAVTGDASVSGNLTVRTTGLVVNATGTGVGMVPVSAFDVNVASRFHSTVRIDGAATIPTSSLTVGSPQAVGLINVQGDLYLERDTDYATLQMMTTHSGFNTGNRFTARRATGSAAVPAALAGGDNILDITAQAYEATGGWVSSSAIIFDTTLPISASVVPGVIRLYAQATAADGGTFLEAMTVRAGAIGIHTTVPAKFVDALGLSGVANPTLRVAVNSSAAAATASVELGAKDDGGNVVTHAALIGYARDPAAATLQGDLVIQTQYHGALIESARFRRDASGFTVFQPSVFDTFYLSYTAAEDRVVAWDTNDYLLYDISANAIQAHVASTRIFTIDQVGGVYVGGDADAAVTAASGPYCWVTGFAGSPGIAPTIANAATIHRYPMMFDTTNKKIGVFDGTGWVFTAAMS